MSKTPAILNAFAPLYDVIIAPGELESRPKLLAYLAASNVNEAPYSSRLYETVAARAGLSDDDLRAVRTEQDHPFSPIEKASMRIARELTRVCALDDIDQNELDLFTQEQLTELVAVVSLANFDNRFENALDIEPEPGS